MKFEKSTLKSLSVANSATGTNGKPKINQEPTEDPYALDLVNWALAANEENSSSPASPSVNAYRHQVLQGALQVVRHLGSLGGRLSKEKGRPSKTFGKSQQVMSTSASSEKKRIPLRLMEEVFFFLALRDDIFNSEAVYHSSYLNHTLRQRLSSLLDFLL